MEIIGFYIDFFQTNPNKLVALFVSLDKLNMSLSWATPTFLNEAKVRKTINQMHGPVTDLVKKAAKVSRAEFAVKVLLKKLPSLEPLASVLRGTRIIKAKISIEFEGIGTIEEEWPNNYEGLSRRERSENRARRYFTYYIAIAYLFAFFSLPALSNWG